MFLKKAVNILRSGGLVAFPTETVYGLGADATNAAAVRKIFLAKERPYDHPLIVHIGSIEQLADWAIDISSQAQKLAQIFWPGPFTMILKKQPHVLDSITGGQDTVGLRIPSHPIAQSLLQAFKGGIVAPSANKFTHISPTTFKAVHEELGDKVDLILEGECEVGLESTIVNMSGSEPVILRPGMITSKQIEKVLATKVFLSNQSSQRAPGMHFLHYAPKTKTRLIEGNLISGAINKLRSEDLPVVFLIHSTLALPNADQIHYIKMPANAPAYAHLLYQILRDLDSLRYKQIMIESVPQGVEWEAIRDRLFKASGSAA